MSNTGGRHTHPTTSICCEWLLRDILLVNVCLFLHIPFTCVFLFFILFPSTLAAAWPFSMQSVLAVAAKRTKPNLYVCSICVCLHRKEKNQSHVLACKLFIFFFLCCCSGQRKSGQITIIKILLRRAWNKTKKKTKSGWRVTDVCTQYTQLMGKTSTALNASRVFDRTDEEATRLQPTEIMTFWWA